MTLRHTLRRTSVVALALVALAWAYSYTRWRSITMNGPGLDPKLVDGALLFKLGSLPSIVAIDGTGHRFHTFWWTNWSFTGASMGMSTSFGPGSPPVTLLTARIIVIPLWLAALPLLILTLILRSRKTRPGLCPSCGYDISATPKRCPECGRESLWLATLRGLLNRGRSTPMPKAECLLPNA